VFDESCEHEVLFGAASAPRLVLVLDLANPFLRSAAAYEAAVLPAHAGVARREYLQFWRARSQPAAAAAAATVAGAAAAVAGVARESEEEEEMEL
jgi:hypothetical protein